jgi:hypothetical protein
MIALHGAGPVPRNAPALDSYWKGEQVQHAVHPPLPKIHNLFVIATLHFTFTKE